MSSNASELIQDPSSPGSDELWRGEIVKQLFGEVGELITDFSCAVESNILLHGRMYVTDRFLCFYSNLFGLEKKIRIPYTHISLITKEKTALVIPNAIAITTFRKEYVFRSFWDRDECFNMLKDLVNKHKGIDGAAAGITVLSDSTHGTKDRAVEESSLSSSTTPQKAASLGNGAIPDGTSTIKTNPRADTRHVEKEGTDDSAKIKSAPRPFEDTEEDIECGREEFDRKRLKSQAVDFVSSFEKELSQSKLKIQVKSVKIPISLDDFVTKFIVDDAPHGWKSYHEATLDKDIIATPWEDDNTTLGASRELRFLKPVALPGLTHARAKKVQRYRKFGDVGLLVCSSTRMEDVPAADTFSVEDMIAVTASGDSEVSVEANFEVKWIKSTIFRRMIESNTIPDVTKWLENFLVHMKNTLQRPESSRRNSQSTQRSRSRSADKANTIVDQKKSTPESLVNVEKSVGGGYQYSGTCFFLSAIVFVAMLSFGAIYQMSLLRSSVESVGKRFDMYEHELHKLRDQVAHGQEHIAAAVVTIDNLKAANAEIVWAALAESDHLHPTSNKEDFYLTMSSLVQGNTADDVDFERQKALLDAINDDSLLQHHMHNLKQLSEISTSLNGVIASLPTGKHSNE